MASFQNRRRKLFLRVYRVYLSLKRMESWLFKPTFNSYFIKDPIFKLQCVFLLIHGEILSQNIPRAIALSTVHWTVCKQWAKGRHRVRFRRDGACRFQVTITYMDFFRKVFAYLTKFKNWRALDYHTHIQLHKQHSPAILTIRLNKHKMTNLRLNN